MNRNKINDNRVTISLDEETTDTHFEKNKYSLVLFIGKKSKTLLANLIKISTHPITICCCFFFTGFFFEFNLFDGFNYIFNVKISVSTFGLSFLISEIIPNVFFIRPELLRFPPLHWCCLRIEEGEERMMRIFFFRPFIFTVLVTFDRRPVPFLFFLFIFFALVETDNSFGKGRWSIVRTAISTMTDD